jgi:putative radical SAM enzyme (TIGR03279 family)
MKIISIEKNSTGEDLGLQVGDELVKINEHPVRDVLDYRFLVAEEQVEMEVRRNGNTIIYELEKDFDDHLGLGFADLKIRHCGNDCPFCFVDQNPKGMRSGMYFRDEDYRLSFLSGHYVTLTNLSKRDMDRIVWQRLSPVYVSVHATEPEVRKFLFGINHDDQLLEKLEFLTKNDIEIHTQIVLCPEINDGPVLKKTIWDLAQFLPNLRSVSIVPVGLTKHRKGLTVLKPVTGEYAKKLIEIADLYAREFQEKIGEYFVYSSDEFYILAGQPLPPAERYDGFYQIENGVGMVRHLLDDFENQKVRFPERLAKPFQATLVTATLASGFMQDVIIPGLNRVENFQTQLQVVVNEFYGSSIGVTGLLTGQDIYNHLSDKELGSLVYLPASCLNEKNIFLDDWSLDELSEKLDCPVVVLNNDFSVMFEQFN